MKTNSVTLSNCAYIFHWSHSNFSWTKSQAEQKQLFQKVLRPLYDVGDEERTFKYVIKGECIVVNINGVDVILCEQMIKHIEGEYSRKNIINNLTFVNPVNLNSKKWHVMNTSGWLIHNKFNSLWIDMFENGLRYYRIRFKRDYINFIVSGHDVYLLTPKYYTKTNKVKICDSLGISTSSQARKDVYELIDYLTK